MSDNVIHLIHEIHGITSRRNITQWEAEQAAFRYGPVTFPSAFHLRLWRRRPSLGEEVCISARDNRGRARQLIKDWRGEGRNARKRGCPYFRGRKSLGPTNVLGREGEREREKTYLIRHVRDYQLGLPRLALLLPDFLDSSVDYNMVTGLSYRRLSSCESDLQISSNLYSRLHLREDI